MVQLIQNYSFKTGVHLGQILKLQKINKTHLIGFVIVSTLGINMSFNKKEKLEWLKLTHLIMKDKKLSKKQLDRFEWLKIKGYYYA